jgi:hypothetical protein
VTGNGGFSGLLTGNVNGDVLATDGTVVLQNGTDGSDAALTGTVSSLSNHDTDDLSEGSTNLYYTSTRADTAAKGAISVTDSGGDGSLAYDSSTGAITYTGPSATDTRAHFSGGTGVSITDGEVSIGQAVSTTDDVTFNNLTLDGDLTVGGTTTTVNSTTVTVADPIFTLGGDTAPTADDNKDRGIEFNWHNGTDAKLGFFGFDDSEGKFTFIPDATNSSEVFTGTAGTVVASTFEGDLTGDVTGTVSDLSNQDTDSLSEGSSNLYFTDDRVTTPAREALSASGGISYNSSTGAFSTDPNSTVQASKLDLGTWEIQQSGTSLKFLTGGTCRMQLDSNGNLTVEGNITAYGALTP